MIGAVVPVYNRRENLKLLLTSLELQTTENFHVVVADDGSTDGTGELVDQFAARPQWSNRITRVSGGPHQGVRTGRARNIGAANLAPGTTLMVMLDSDLILPPHAMERFAEEHVKYPAEVLYGSVDWLPPLSHEDVYRAVVEGAMSDLRTRIPTGRPQRVQGTFVGHELREELFAAPASASRPLLPQWALPLNSAWPVELYWAVGGFDETMTGYGYQDMELGARAARADARCVPEAELWALHVWHPKPAAAMSENQRNLDRYLRRNGPNGVSEVDVDWTCWFHYHAERGGSVVRANGQLWAISGDHAHRLALPDDAWLDRLGHCRHAPTGPPDLAAIIDHGTAGEEISGDRHIAI